MLKRLTVAGLGALLLVAPSFALAQTADVQSQIAALQAQVQALLAQIAALQNNATTSSSCPTFSQNLTLGSTGSDVSNLQNFLASEGYFSAETTGYYGFVTAEAVGKFQLASSILSSSDDSAYGIFGPQTRTAATNACNGSTQPDGTQSMTNPVVISNFQVNGYSPYNGPIQPGTQLTFIWQSNLTDNDIAHWQGGCFLSARTASNKQVTLAAEAGASGSIAYTPTETATYTMDCTSGGKDGSPEAIQTMTVPVVQPGGASATIDQSSLTTGSATPTITGTASGISSVYILVRSLSSSDPVGNVEEGPTPVDVTNGRWSTGVLYGKGGFTPGTYTVSIENGLNGPLLTTGILVIGSGSSSIATDVATLMQNVEAYRAAHGVYPKADPAPGDNEPVSNVSAALASYGGVPQSLIDAGDKFVSYLNQGYAIRVRQSDASVCRTGTGFANTGWWAQYPVCTFGSPHPDPILINKLTDSQRASAVLAVQQALEAYKAAKGTYPTADGSPESLYNLASTLAPYGTVSQDLIAEGTRLVTNGSSQYALLVRTGSSATVLSWCRSGLNYANSGWWGSAPSLPDCSFQPGSVPTVVAGANASATIDQGSLSDTTATPVITGTASNTNTIKMSLALTSGSPSPAFGGTAQVTNGRWSLQILPPALSQPALPNGTYTLSVYDASNTLLTTGTLTVNAPARAMIADLINEMAIGLEPVDLQYDLNGDGKITAADALAYLKGQNPGSPSPVSASWTGPQSFDGSTSVPFSSAAALSSAFTLSAWVYPTALTQHSFGLGVGGTIIDASQGPAGGYDLGINSSGKLWWWPYGGGDMYSNATIPLNTWTHVVLAYDGATARMYVNGSPDATKTLRAPTATQIATNIGGKSWITGSFVGSLAQVQVYTGALTSAQVASLYAANPAPATPSDSSSTGTEAQTASALEALRQALAGIQSLLR